MAHKTYQTYRCGGYASYYGHCGALDCETCHPGGAREMALDEETEELRAERELIEADMSSIEAKMDALSDENEEEYASLMSEANTLASRLAEINEEIKAIENRLDGGYDEPDYEPDYDRYAGEGEVDWESPY
jgi:hypothetical protein